MAVKKNSSEEQLNELQETINKLESGNALLEDALNEFQAGVKSSRELEKRLNDTEQIVAKLANKDRSEKTLDPQSASAPEEE